MHGHYSKVFAQDNIHDGERGVADNGGCPSLQALTPVTEPACSGQRAAILTHKCLEVFLEAPLPVFLLFLFFFILAVVHPPGGRCRRLTLPPLLLLQQRLLTCCILCRLLRQLGRLLGLLEDKTCSRGASGN
jgi:hypothetical protein